MPPEETDNEVIRWSILDPLYKKVIDIVYNNDLTGNEIDTLINMVWSKIVKDKIVTVSYFEVQRMLTMDAVAKTASDTKPKSFPGIT